jgi:PAS domain S-box-containing protein
VYLEDVTERKRAEERLIASERRFRRVLEIDTVGVIFFDEEGNVTDVNDAFLTMSGFDREDVERGLISWQQMTPPEWMERSEQAFEELKGTGKTTPYEKEYLRKDGSRWWGLFAATLLDGGQGVEFVIDVSERRRAEEERERFLAQEWRARAEAEERKRISRELHDRVAHSIGVVHQSLELYEVFKEGNPSQAEAKIKLARETTREALDVTRNISRELHNTEAKDGLSVALSNLLKTTVPPGLETNVALEGDEALIPPRVREQLFLILREAVRNAVSHSGADRLGIEVKVSPERVVGRVRDDGRGLEAAPEGDAASGSGLRSMEERAELVGGALRVSSAPGRGTRIEASIPLSRMNHKGRVGNEEGGG